jgi:hypothetical protein
MFRGSWIALLSAVAVFGCRAEALAQQPETFSTTMSVSEVVQAAAQEMARHKFQIVTTDINTGLVVGKRSGTPYELLQTIECSDKSMRDLVEQSLTVTVRQERSATAIVEISSDARIVNSGNQFQNCRASDGIISNLRNQLRRVTTASLQAAVNEVMGRYVFKTGKANPGDYIEFTKDGRFQLQQRGKSYTGEYAVDGSAIYLHLQRGKRPDKAILSGTTLTDSSGWTWEKVVVAAPAETAASLPATSNIPPATSGITIDQLLKMIEAKLPDDVIVKMLDGGKRPVATPEDLLRLRGAGASDAVIRALMK